MPSRLDYAAHIAELIKRHRVKVHWQRSPRGWAHRKYREMRTRPIKSAVTYAIALHELGHILGPQRGRLLNREWQAWEWAIANALEWTTPMKVTAKRCLCSYLAKAHRRKGMWLPPFGHPFYQIASAKIN